jgi:hypothetical protein
MTVAASLSLSPTAPKHGDTVTATYTVTGNDGTPAGADQTASVVGTVRVGDQDLQVHTDITLPGTAAVDPLPVTYAVPTVAGLTFVGTSKANIFTALVP